MARTEREYWVVTLSGEEVSGPYDTEQGACGERNDRQADYDEELIVINNHDAY